MTALHYDGTYTLYVLQVNQENVWVDASLDYFYEARKILYTARGAHAWQETGIHASFDLEIAKKMLQVTKSSRRLKKDHKASDFRLRKVVISQQSMAPKEAPVFEEVEVETVEGYVWCDVHGCVHDETNDPYNCGYELSGDEPECGPQTWRSLYYGGLGVYEGAAA